MTFDTQPHTFQIRCYLRVINSEFERLGLAIPGPGFAPGLDAVVIIYLAVGNRGDIVKYQQALGVFACADELQGSFSCRLLQIHTHPFPQEYGLNCIIITSLPQNILQ